jgi:hypothetical protein
MKIRNATILEQIFFLKILNHKTFAQVNKQANSNLM